MKPTGPQARPRGAGPAPGAQRQRTAGEHRGVAHALPAAARSNWPCAPPRSRPGKFSRSTASQAALTPHHRAPCSRSPPPWGLSTQSQWARSAAGREAPGRTNRPTDGLTDNASKPTGLPQKDSDHHKGAAPRPSRESASARTGRELQTPGAFASAKQHTSFPRGLRGPGAALTFRSRRTCSTDFWEM